MATITDLDDDVFVDATEGSGPEADGSGTGASASLRGLARRGRAALRVQRTRLRLARDLPAVLIVVAAVIEVAWLAGWMSALALLVVAVVASSVGAGCIAASSWRQPIGDVEVLRRLEGSSESLDGVLITAWQLDDADAWHTKPRSLADRMASELDVDRALAGGPTPRWSMCCLAGSVLACVVLVSFVGSRADAAAAVNPVLAAEAETLEELADALQEAEDDPDTPLDENAEADALADELRSLAEEIRSAEDPLEAAESLNERKAALQEAAGDDRLADRAAVHGLEQQVVVSPLADAVGAAAQLDALAAELESLDERGRDELADRLDRLAEGQRSGDADVAGELAAAATALRSGDAGVASAALTRAASGHRAAAADVARRDAAAAAAGVADASAARLRDPNSALSGARPGDGGERDGEGNGDGQGQGNGNGNGAGQGNGNGQGNGSDNGQGGTGGQPTGGGGAGDISGVQPSGGSPSGQGGVGQPGAGESSEGGVGIDLAGDDATVFSPNVEEVKVDLDGGTGDGEVVGRGDANTQEGVATVPFREVLPSYLAAAAERLDTLALPPDLRSTVRDYFDHLAGN